MVIVSSLCTVGIDTTVKLSRCGGNIGGSMSCRSWSIGASTRDLYASTKELLAIFLDHEYAEGTCSAKVTNLSNYVDMVCGRARYIKIPVIQFIITYLMYISVSRLISIKIL